MQDLEVIKVLVVDDSALMRSEITKMLESDNSIHVVGTARNGEQVLERVKTLNPDVVTMDIEMPKMNGLEALNILMQKAPCPVIMVSALTEAGAEETLTALEHGAFDFIQKPSGSISLDIAKQRRLLIEKVKAAAQSKKHFISKKEIPPAIKRTENKITPSRVMPGKLEVSHIIGVGISTGGPNALMKFLPLIPGDINVSILIVQHMPEKFTASLAKRLNKICQMKVKEAEDGEIIERGCMYIAPGGKHMAITERNAKIRFIKIREGSGTDYNCPSVDVLFHSLYEQLGKKWLGIILTGMGSDGAEGLLRLKKLGGHTIAQSKESCIVYGMPKRAVEKGAVEYVLSLENIPGKIVELYEKKAF